MKEDKNNDAMYRKLVIVAVIGVIATLFISMTALINTYSLDSKINLLHDKIERINSYEQEMRYEVTALKEDVNDLRLEVETLRNTSSFGDFNFNLDELDLGAILDGLGGLDGLFGGEFDSDALNESFK